MDPRKQDLDALESFARSVAALRGASVDVDVAELAALYEVEWPGADDDDQDEGEEPTDDELAEAHRQREAAAR